MNFRLPSALLAAGALAFTAAACGDDEESTSGGSSSKGSSDKASKEKPVAQIDSLTGTSTKVVLDAGFLDALKSLKVTPGAVGDATVSKAGVASFPITGGNLVYYPPSGSVTPYVQGLVNHDGSGLSLKAGGKTVKLKNFDVDPGKSVLTGDVSVDGSEAAPDAPLFFLDGRTLKALRTNADGSKAVLEGTTVKLKKEAADLLNETFGIDALKPGLIIGKAKITVRTGA
jgi:hypothetical protein